jgi:Lipase (class 3)
MALVGQKSASGIPQGSQLAYSLCDWVDHVATQKNPPSPWTIAWQPKKITTDYSAVLQNGSQYALVIQGTHGNLDKLEDFACEFWVSFDPISGAKVALGAQAALFDMLIQTNNLGMDLGFYLQSISSLWDASSPLLIAGHSLGGTLSALAAAWIGFQLLNNEQPLTSLPTSIQAFSFAPFAAGNQAFAAFFNGSSNYVPCFNENDAIPHAWATDATANPIFNIANLYNLFPKPGPQPMPNGKIKTAIQNKVTQMQNNNVSYMQVTGPNSYTFAYPTTHDLGNWDAEAIYQHNKAYADTFGTSSAAGKASATSPQSDVA